MIQLDSHGNIGLELALLIGQSAEVELTNLNDADLPDAYWTDVCGKTHGTEIKQPGEVLGRLLDVEEQLAREYQQVDHLALCITGVVVPAVGASGCKLLNWSADGKAGYLSGIRGGEPYHQDYGGYRAKLRAWESWGITVVEVPTKLALAQHLVACYRYDQKPEEQHLTFKQPIRVKRPMGHWDAYVLSLMSRYDPATGKTFLGPDRAKALLEQFMIPAAVDRASIKALCEVPGIGKGLAMAIKRSAGLGE